MKKEQKRNPVAAMAFLCYAALMIFLLFAEDRVASDGLPYWEQVKHNCSFKFFHTIGNYWDVLTRPEYYITKWEAYGVYRFQARVALINLLGNVVMFVPLGAFLPMLWQKLQKAWKAILVGLLTVVLVELCQLLTLRGKCDVDDLLLNMAGVILGYGLWRLIGYCRRKRK